MLNRSPKSGDIGGRGAGPVAAELSRRPAIRYQPESAGRHDLILYRHGRTRYTVGFLLRNAGIGVHPVFGPPFFPSGRRVPVRLLPRLRVSADSSQGLTSRDGKTYRRSAERRLRLPRRFQWSRFLVWMAGPVPAQASNPSRRRWPAQSVGNVPIRRSRRVVKSTGCRPARMASTMSGSRKAS